MGVTGFFGNPGSAGETLGGSFSTTPRGVAVNDVNGRVYVADAGNNRVQRFSAGGSFERAIGFDVIQPGKPGDTGTGFEICTVAADCKAGINSVLPAPGGEISSPQGIAINQATGDFYVSEAFFRVQQFDADGNFIRAWGRDVVQSGTEQADEQQALTVNASAGQYRLTFGADTTADIEWNEPAAGVEAKLNALASIGGAGGSVTVAGGPAGDSGGTPYLITFGGALANTNLAPIATSAGTVPLSGGAASAAIAIFNDGGEGFEICNTASNCKQGAGGSIPVPGGAFSNIVGYVAVAPAGAPNAGNVLVGDGNRRRVQEFAGSGQFVRAFGYDVALAGPGNTGTGFEVCRAALFDVCKEGVAGNGVGQFGNVSGANPNIRVAVDTTGAIYTVEPASPNFRVQKFTPSGVGLTPSPYCPGIGGAETLCGTSAATTPTDVAVDPTDNHVYVAKAFPVGSGNPAAASAERRVLELSPAETLVDTHLAGYGVNSVNGLALKAGGEPLYITSSTPKSGVYIVGEPVPPHVTVEPTTDVTATSATLHGTVNPNGGGPLHTTYRFEYTTTDFTNCGLPANTACRLAPISNADVGSGEDPVAVDQPIVGLQPNKEYRVRVVAFKGGSPTASTATIGDFKTVASGPTVETFAAYWDANAGELVLRGSVNPNNSPATYFFEYGPVPCSVGLCTSVPATEDASAGSGGEPVVQTQRVAGLDPATTYHFRIVADNGIGAAVVGADRSITTPARPACANAQLRSGASAGLPECRAYEWVSEGDSWGSGVNPEIGSIADSGNRAQFNAQAFGQPKSIPGPSTPYFAERGPEGWTVRGMLPEPASAEGSGGGTRRMFAADLGAVLWPESSFGQRLRGEVRWSYIDIGGNVAAASDLLVPLDHAGAGRSGDEYPLLGASGDLSTFVFTYQTTELGATGIKLLPDELLLESRERSNLYMISGGQLDIVNRASNPAPDTPGEIIGGACGAGLGSVIETGETTRSMSNAVSGDGSVVYFSIRPSGPPAGTTCDGGTYPKRLYKRIGGETTVEISACAKSNSGTCTSEGDDNYRGASRDGSVVFFVSPRQLTDSDQDSTEDLYVYDASLPADQRLTQASAGKAVPGDHPVAGAGAEVVNVLDNSADGSRVYFVAKGRLTPAAGDGVNNLYVFERSSAHPAGRIGYIGAVGGAEANSSARASSFALPSGQNGDGQFLLFTTGAKLLPEDLDSARDLYRYDDSSAELLCLTCAGNGVFDVRIASRQGANEESQADYAQRARPASADVSAVVFTTKEALLEDADLNGAIDVYLWREGSLAMISGGSGEVGVESSNSESGISPDGRNVFFLTRAKLVGRDVNNGLDLYDARVDGGFAEQTTPPRCTTADSCQGPGGAAPASAFPASAAFQGSGNPSRKKPCRKGFVRRRGKCVKKTKPRHSHKKHSRKRANAKHGGNR